MRNAEDIFSIRREQCGHLVRVDLNRPDEGNAVTREMMTALSKALHVFGNDRDVCAIVIEGRGPDFCRGRDAKGDDRSGMSAYEIEQRIMQLVLGVYGAIELCPVPVVACVQGLAAGFGAAMSMACDMTLSSDAARFSFPEINHRIPPALAMSTLVGKVPPKTISYLIYSGREIEAAEALDYGMISRCFPDQDFRKQADELVAEMAARPRVVLETIKRYERNSRILPKSMASDYAGVLLALAQTEIKKPN